MGKHINELRRKASDKALASRAKSLVKKWRTLLTASGGTPTPTPGSTPATPKISNNNSQKLTNGHVKTNAASLQQQLASLPNSRVPSPANSRLTSPAASNHSTTVITPTTTTSKSVPNSSLPSSASSSPSLSRPTTPNNGLLHHHQQHHANHNSRPVSPAVPKTNAANKRLRKDDGAISSPEDQQQPPRKKVKPEVDSPPRVLNGAVIKSEPRDTPTSATAASKRTTRKQKQDQEREHLLEQKLLSARRSNKVRTTEELVKELAQRSTAVNNTPAASSGSTAATAVTDLNESKSELMTRFLESQAENGLSPPLSGAPSPEAVLPSTSNGCGSEAGGRETVEDVLAKLPPIDVAAVLAEMNSEIEAAEPADDGEEVEGLIPVPKTDPQPMSDEVKAAMVQELHTGKHESVNGNFAHDGVFREWHEVVSKESLSGDLLYILPYSIID